MKFNKNYFFLFIILFVIEVLIAFYIHDDFIRPYFGDFLVVILIYTFLMSFYDFSKFYTAVFVLVFAFAIEFAQYFNVVALLGLQNNKIAKVVLGSSFSVEDLFIYFLAFVFISYIEMKIDNKKTEDKLN